MDETWTVTVNGQMVPVGVDGGFLVPNVSAADQFGPAGPGNGPPDCLSDDEMRLIAVQNLDGVTRWAYSAAIRLASGETYLIGDLTLTEEPPPGASRIGNNNTLRAQRFSR